MPKINEIPVYQILLQWAYQGEQYTGLNGETTFDPLDYLVSIHDGVTPGGIPLKVDITHVLNRALVAETNSYNDLDDKPDLNIANWNTAYGWGNHAGLYDLLGSAASEVSGHESTYSHANYNTAYGWGNHAGLYDLLGSAASEVSGHESTYNHASFITGISKAMVEAVLTGEISSHSHAGLGFSGWNLSIDGNWKELIGDNGNFHLRGGTNVQLGYAAGGEVTINAAHNHNGVYDFYEQWRALINGAAALTIGKDDQLDFIAGAGIVITTDGIDKITISSIWDIIGSSPLTAMTDYVLEVGNLFCSRIEDVVFFTGNTIVCELLQSAIIQSASFAIDYTTVGGTDSVVVDGKTLVFQGGLFISAT